MRSIRVIARRIHGMLPRRALALVALGLAGGLMSCGTIEPVTPFTPGIDPTQFYRALTLDHPAVALSTVAPYHTIQLTATPRDALGNPMAGLPAPIYTSSDPVNVAVTADGLVTALGTASGVSVVARLATGPISHVDTAMINVTNLAPPRPASLSLQPVPPDTAIHPLAGSGLFADFFIPFFAGILPSPLAPRVVDSMGNAVEGLPFTYTSLDPSIAIVGHREGYVGGRQVGQARLVAQTTAYGITLTDTVLYTITLPFGVEIHVAPDTTMPGFATIIAGGALYGEATNIHLVPHGIVLWLNNLAEEVDVTFDDPTNVAQPDAALCDALAVFINCDGGGNTILPANTTDDVTLTFRLRQFHVPGVYPFHSARLGSSGRITVGN